MRKPPKYQHHKPSGLAFVEIKGQRIYLGKHGTPESYAEYARVIAVYLETGEAPPKVTPATGLTVAGLVEHFRKSALSAYDYRVRGHLKPILEILTTTFGKVLAADFGPVKFEEVRAAFVNRGWSRNYVNFEAGKLKQVLRWAVGRELYPAAKLAAIREVPGLRAGKTKAPETEPRTAPPEEAVAATLPELTVPARGIALLQFWTGCRPGEAVIAQRADVNTDGVAVLPGGLTRTFAGVWVYCPGQHKGTWRGKRKYILIGPRGQAALQPYIDACKTPSDYLFRPSDVRKATRAGKHYSPESYARALFRARRRAGAADWTAYQLRHRYAAIIRDDHGIEAAKEVLGHTHTDMTDHYAKQGLEKAAEAARISG